MLRRCHILAGLAIVENAYDETAKIEAVAPAAFEAREESCCGWPAQWLPRLPFDRADLLLIDEIGKDISGTGSTPTWWAESTYTRRRTKTSSPRSSTSPCAA